ncbi:ABC transporter ATP-binding protein [Niveibacterium sp. SC-1]|uniref:ABC transporter ATP-binding protein n=1 Tax=Niveibacterium sp. SC-1 TaxID=3135646 RepID=UPI00311FAB95
MSEPLLDARDLSVHIDTPDGVVKPLAGVSFALQAGETYALLGESGCGKSMTAYALMRLLPPGGRLVGGDVLLQGRSLPALAEAQMRDVRGGEMAMIFQEPGTSLDPVATVGRQISEVLRLHRGLEAEDARREAVALLRQVGIADPERRIDEYPFQFSGGMKQRVMIAMALAGQPRLLIADEPTTALDVTVQAQVLELMAGLQRERGMAMLLITHDLGVVSRMAQRVGVMYAGHLVEEAPHGVFFAKSAHPYSQKLFEALPQAGARGAPLASLAGSVPPLTRDFVGCRFGERCPHAWQRCHEEAPAWHEVETGQRVRCHLYDAELQRATKRDVAPPVAAEAAAPAEEDPAVVLAVRDVSVHFPIRRGLLQRQVGVVKAVEAVSLEIPAGRTLALVGESGSGKTTLAKAILQLVLPTAGRIALSGHEITPGRGADAQRLRAQVQMVFQDPFSSLNPRLTVAQILDEGMRALGVSKDAQVRRRRTLDLLDQVGLRAEAAERYPHEFSGGQRQRIAIARALAVSPRLLICDEPTSALDVSVQAQILNLLRTLQKELGLAYLFITHNLAVVEYLAHEVAVMREGRIVEAGEAQSVFAAPRSDYTRSLLAAVPRLA